MDAIRGLGIELDQDYDRPEGRQVFDVLEEFGVSGDEVVSDLADYFGVTEDYVEDNIDVIAQNRATKEILDKAIEGGIEQVDPGETAADAYTEGEKDAVFGLLQDGTLSIPAAAEYFQLPVEEIQAAYDSMLASREADQTALDAVAAQPAQSATEQLSATLDDFGDADLAAALASGELDESERQRFAEGGRLLFDEMGNPSDSPQFNIMSTTLSNRPTMGPPEKPEETPEKENSFLDTMTSL